jgi:hypothetical protein
VIGLSPGDREEVIRRRQDAKSLKELEAKRNDERASVLSAKDALIASAREELKKAEAPISYREAARASSGESGVRELEEKRQAAIALVRKRLDSLAADKAKSASAYNADTQRLLTEQKTNQLFQAQERAIERARSIEQQRRQDLREIEQRQGEAKRAAMQPSSAKANEIDERYRFGREDIKVGYEERTRGVTDPDRLRFEQDRARELLKANEKSYLEARKKYEQEQVLSRNDLLKRWINEAVATTVVAGENAVQNFRGTGGIAGGVFNIGQGIFDAVTLKKFFKDQEDSKDYLKRMYDLLKKQQQPKVFTGTL